MKTGQRVNETTSQRTVGATAASVFAIIARGGVTTSAPKITYMDKPTESKWCDECKGFMPHAYLHGKYVCGVCGTERDA